MNLITNISPYEYSSLLGEDLIQDELKYVCWSVLKSKGEIPLSDLAISKFN